MISAGAQEAVGHTQQRKKKQGQAQQKRKKQGQA